MPAVGRGGVCVVGEGELLNSGKGSGASLCPDAGFVEEVILFLLRSDASFSGWAGRGEWVVDSPIG